MCGIFGIVSSKYDNNKLKSIIKRLFILSESRGKEASGFAFLPARSDSGEQNGKIAVYKSPLPASELVKSSEFKNLFNINAQGGLLIGHSRLVTNGYEYDNINNQPFVKNGIVGIHNGIVVNIEKLLEKYSNLKPITQLDSEIFPSLLNLYKTEGYSLSCSVKKLFLEIEGMGNIALLFNYLQNLLLVSNNGSLYYIHTNNTFIFASESLMLKKLIEKEKLGISNNLIKQLNPNNALLLDIFELSLSIIDIKDANANFNNEIVLETPIQINELSSGLNKKSIYINKSLNHEQITVSPEFIEHYNSCKEKIALLKCCTKCLLPETFPFIEFDEQGVCNKCNSYIKQKPLGIEALKEKIAPFKKNNGKPDCIVAFSGGRDSSYSLHVIKENLGLSPLAYSYDWGMLTDLARRNQARMCGKLCVEHILVSADIQKKRINIRKNVLAWLNKPHLGTIPLFMAGDKQYFYYASKLRKQYNLPLLIMGENYFEKTGFKIEFTGAQQEQKGYMSYHISTKSKLKMLGFYAKEYLLNPAYLNTSLLDTVGAYFAYYGSKHDYVNLYDYLYWNELEVNDLLLKQYDWETDPETNSTWRIGDGTAAFYNYIYYTIAGFTEHDTFRSNQIREGILSREDALKLSKIENQPRWSAIKWYCDTIGIDFENTIKRINVIKKLY
jgi:hypothetical protein